MKVRTLTLLATALATALLAAPLLAEETPTAAQITEKWRSYFETLQKTPSWSYATRMQLWEKDPKNAAAPQRLVTDIKTSFAQSDRKFRREMSVKQSEKAPYQTVTMAYNGQKYQMAVQNPEPTMIEGHPVRHMLLQEAKPFPNDPTLTMGVHLPLTMSFIFVAENLNDVPFATLPQADVWTNLQKRITKIAPDTWNGRNGFTLTVLDKPGEPGDKHAEVFMDGASGLPLHLKNVNSKTQTLIGEIKVTQVHESQNGLPAFPLRVEIEGAGSAKAATENPGGTGVVEVLPASLTFGPIEASRFAIPLNSVEIAIENDKVIYSRLPKPAAKPPAKQPVKPKIRNKPKG